MRRCAGVLRASLIGGFFMRRVVSGKKNLVMQGEIMTLLWPRARLRGQGKWEESTECSLDEK